MADSRTLLGFSWRTRFPTVCCAAAAAAAHETEAEAEAEAEAETEAERQHECTSVRQWLKWPRPAPPSARAPWVARARSAI
jgi:hypothetical protein